MTAKQKERTRARLVKSFWARDRQLQNVPRYPYCLHWLTTGRCDALDQDPTAVDQCGACGRQRWWWWDDVSGWTDPNGRRVLLCQPYVTSGKEALASLRRACAQFNLKVTITRYSPGRRGLGTLAIELTPAD